VIPGLYVCFQWGREKIKGSSSAAQAPAASGHDD